jgi:NhaA family Na+:H+ antiporter
MQSKSVSALAPVLPGIGSMMVPAFIYVAFNWGTNNLEGWPIPAVNDMAFALGILANYSRIYRFIGLNGLW